MARILYNNSKQLKNNSMKNKFLKLASVALVFNAFGMNAIAQNAHEVSTTINKVQKTAFQCDYKATKDLMKTTIEERFKKAGLSSGKKSKGYTKYTGVTFSELSPNKIDIYTKVEGKKDNSSVIMLVSTGYDNFISTTTDAITAANTITFLNNLNDDAVDMKAAIDLAAQQKAVKEAEEKLKKSEKEAAKLAKKKAKLEKQMEAEGKTSDKAIKDVEAEKMRLENLKGQNAAEEGASN